jgi:hypothetical protein
MSNILLEFNNHCISTGDMSLTTGLSSQSIDISNVYGYCVQANWTGVPVGNITVSGSNDNINFKVLDTQVTGGASGVYFDNKDAQHYNYCRIDYIRTSGTGTLDVFVSAKRSS